MSWSDKPTNAQLGAIYSMIKWKVPKHTATGAVQWLAEKATRRDVSYEMKRIRGLYQKHALDASNCFVGDIWEGFEHD